MKSLCLTLSLCAAAFGQPAFENVVIRATAPGAQMTGGRFRPGVRFEADGYTMMDLLSRAYGLPWERIIGGPPWVGTDRFDVLATIPANASSNDGQAMIQALLAERFKLAVHRDTRPIPAYDLLPRKRPLLKETTGGDARCKYDRAGSTIDLVCTNMTLDQFTRELADYAPDYFDRALLDKTRLAGRYDLTLRWTPRNQRRLRTADGEMDGTSVQDALDQQLGLKVEIRPEPMPVLVVDSVNRTPTPNVPGAIEAVNAPAYTEFDVAEVRVHKPETPFKYNDTETLSEYMGFTLPVLIGIAWNTPPQKREVVGGPEWMKTEKFDIIAKPVRRVPGEDIQLMLRNLYMQRFQLSLHEEERLTTVYALTIRKRTAKLMDAAPGRRSECRKTLGPGDVTLACKNTTMKQLEGHAREEGWTLLDHTVLDMTGLTGAYDFSVTWVPSPRVGPPAGGADAVAPVASTPTGDLTFFDALDKQLGIKLELQKRPFPTLVVDRAELPKEQ